MKVLTEHSSQIVAAIGLEVTFYEYSQDPLSSLSKNYFVGFLPNKLKMRG